MYCFAIGEYDEDLGFLGDCDDVQMKEFLELGIEEKKTKLLKKLPSEDKLDLYANDVSALTGVSKKGDRECYKRSSIYERRSLS